MTVKWPEFRFTSTSNSSLSIKYNDEDNKWELFNGEKRVTRRKRIMSLLEEADKIEPLGKPVAKTKLKPPPPKEEEKT